MLLFYYKEDEAGRLESRGRQAGAVEAGRETLRPGRRAPEDIPPLPFQYSFLIFLLFCLISAWGFLVKLIILRMLNLPFFRDN
jgi:hypothetical protein